MLSVCNRKSRSVLGMLEYILKIRLQKKKGGGCPTTKLYFLPYKEKALWQTEL